MLPTRSRGGSLFEDECSHHPKLYVEVLRARSTRHRNMFIVPRLPAQPQYWDVIRVANWLSQMLCPATGSRAEISPFHPDGVGLCASTNINMFAPSFCVCFCSLVSTRESLYKCRRRTPHRPSKENCFTFLPLPKSPQTLTPRALETICLKSKSNDHA